MGTSNSTLCNSPLAAESNMDLNAENGQRLPGIRIAKDDTDLGSKEENTKPDITSSATKISSESKEPEENEEKSRKWFRRGSSKRSSKKTEGISNKDATFNLNSETGGGTVIGNQQNIYNNVPKKSSASRSEINLTFKLIQKSFEQLYKSEEAFYVSNSIWSKEKNIEHYYTDLILEELERGGERISETSIELNDVLKKDIRTVARKRLLIQGEAGFGKSTLCTKLAYDWADDKDDSFVKKFDLVILFRLRNLGSDSLQNTLVSLCHSHSGEEGDNYDVTMAAIRQRSDKILLILDGYDELSEEQKISLNEVVGTKTDGPQSIFRASTIIVTTRPVNYPNHRKLYERLVSLQGISKENVPKFIEKFFKGDETKINGLSQFLEKKNLKVIHELSPFLLHVICHLYQNDELNETAVTQYSLLDKVVHLMSKCCVEREKLNMSEDDIETTLITLGEFFYGLPNDKKLVVPLTELASFFDENDLNFVTKFGLLNPISSSVLSARTSVASTTFQVQILEPLHKLFMEFLITKHFRYKLELMDTDQKKCDYIASNISDSTQFSVLCPSLNETVVIAPTIFPSSYFYWLMGNGQEDGGTILASSSFAMVDDIRGLLNLSNRPAPLSVNFNNILECIKFANPVLPHNLKVKIPLLYILETIRLHPFTVNFYLYQDSKMFLNDQDEKISIGVQCLDNGKTLWDAVLTWRCNQPLNPELVDLGSCIKASIGLGSEIKYKLTWMKATFWATKVDLAAEWFADIYSTIIEPAQNKMIVTDVTTGCLAFDILSKLASNKLGTWRGKLDVGHHTETSDDLASTFESGNVRITSVRKKFFGQEVSLLELNERRIQLSKVMKFQSPKKSKPRCFTFEIHSSFN